MARNDCHPQRKTAADRKQNPDQTSYYYVLRRFTHSIAQTEIAHTGGGCKFRVLRSDSRSFVIVFATLG